MGRGRTTTGMIIGCLWLLVRGLVDPKVLDGTRARKQEAEELKLKQDEAVLQDKLKDLPAEQQEALVADYQHWRALRKGWYKSVVSLTRVIPDGPATKKLVDTVIDHNGTFQNLRECVFDMQQTAINALPRKQALYIRRGANYLIRYFYLILIGSYFKEQVQQNFRIGFAQYVAQRPEISHILENIHFPDVIAKTSLSAPIVPSPTPPIPITPIQRSADSNTPAATSSNAHAAIEDATPPLSVQLQPIAIAIASPGPGSGPAPAAGATFASSAGSSVVSSALSANSPTFLSVSPSQQSAAWLEINRRQTTSPSTPFPLNPTNTTP